MAGRAGKVRYGVIWHCKRTHSRTAGRNNNMVLMYMESSSRRRMEGASKG